MHYLILPPHPSPFAPEFPHSVEWPFLLHFCCCLLLQSFLARFPSFHWVIIKYLHILLPCSPFSAPPPPTWTVINAFRNSQRERLREGKQKQKITTPTTSQKAWNQEKQNLTHSKNGEGGRNDLIAECVCMCACVCVGRWMERLHLNTPYNQAHYTHLLARAAMFITIATIIVITVASSVSLLYCWWFK